MSHFGYIPAHFGYFVRKYRRFAPAGVRMPDIENEAGTEFVEYEPELFVGDGELWIRDRDAFCDKYGIVGIDRYDGGILALIPGRGAVPLHDLLKADKPFRSV